jgi:DNA-binding protein HU-beta
MTKSELVAKIAREAGISNKAADKALNSFIGAIHDSLKGPERQIRIPDLGTFKVTKRSARTGVNPRTGEKLDIPASEVPGFSASKALKETVKG